MVPVSVADDLRCVTALRDCHGGLRPAQCAAKREQFGAIGSNGEAETTLALSVMRTFVMQKNKKAKKPLALHQETLRVMTYAELAVVAGGSTGTGCDNTAGKVTSAACGG
jgi:hypothetical protein